MHEILAPLIFVLHCDSAATQHLSTAGELPEELVVISNGSELKADCFVLFRTGLALGWDMVIRN